MIGVIEGCVLLCARSCCLRRCGLLGLFPGGRLHGFAAWPVPAGSVEDERARVSTRLYAVGTSSTVRMVEVIRPPMTVTAIGWRKLLPVPRPSDTGNMPRISARVVIRMGRSRMGPAARIASMR